MKALLLAGALSLAIPAASIAQTSHSPGASGFAPGQEQKTPGGAAALSPGHQMQKARAAGKKVPRGASTYAPGHKMKH
jgi:hypothetical protein